MAFDIRNQPQIPIRSQFELVEAEFFEAVRVARTRLVAASADDRPHAILNFKRALDAFHRLIVDHKLPQEWEDRLAEKTPGAVNGPCMTITYPTGAVREAVLLTSDDNSLRVALPNGQVREFTRVRGVWLSDACEPITVVFQVIGI